MWDMAGLREEVTTEEGPKSLGQKSILDVKVKSRSVVSDSLQPHGL